jgi:poly-gamma-glutamate system protein
VMDLKPVIISSAGSSSWGANWEEFTWLDMETALVNGAIWNYKSVAASIGGGNDHGRGFSPAGRDLLEQAIIRNNVALISSIDGENPTGSLQANIDKRIEIFDRELKGNSLKAVVNVGGGLAAIGSPQNGKLILPGYNSHLYEQELPARGTINIMAERRIPAIHLLQLAEFAEKYKLPVEATPAPEIGKGLVFIQEKYSITTTLIYTVILLAMLWGAIRFDFRYYIYRNKHLFVKKNR